MAKKKRIVRGIDERIEAARLRLEKMESKKAFLTLRNAVRDGRVPKGNLTQYRKSLREAATLEKASIVLTRHELEDAAEAAMGLHLELILELESLLTKPSKRRKASKKKPAKKRSA